MKSNQNQLPTAGNEPDRHVPSQISGLEAELLQLRESWQQLFKRCDCLIRPEIQESRPEVDAPVPPMSAVARSLYELRVWVRSLNGEIQTCSALLDV